MILKSNMEMRLEIYFVFGKEERFFKDILFYFIYLYLLILFFLGYLCRDEKDQEISPSPIQHPRQLRFLSLLPPLPPFSLLTLSSFLSPGLDTSNPIVDELAVLRGVSQPGKRRNDQMKALEESLTGESTNPPLPPAKRARMGEGGGGVLPAKPVSNPDEIDLDMGDESGGEEEGGEGGDVEQLVVPKAVFGGLLSGE